MKRDNVNYVLVGAAVVLAFGGLLAVLFAITGRGGGAVSYRVDYDNVTGLAQGAPVFYEGYRIGQVAEIVPLRGSDGVRYRVELAVREDWPLPDDSIARLQSSGLLADVSVAIREGRSATMLAPGGSLRGEAGADVFAAMNELAAELTVLTRERIRPLVDTLATRMDSLSGALDASAPDLLADAQRLLGRLNTAADGLDQVLGPQNRHAVGAILGDVQAVTRELRGTQQRVDRLIATLDGTVNENRADLRQTMQDLERTVGAMAQRIDAIAHHLESASRNLDEFSREIRRHPNRLLFTPPADKEH